MINPYLQIGPFKGGIDNVNHARSLSKDTLREAVNLDIDNVGRLYVKPSLTTVHTTASHSLFSSANGLIGLVMEGPLLRRINPDNSRTTIYNLGSSEPVYYDEYMGMIYFSNGFRIGKTNGGTASELLSIDQRPFKSTMLAGEFLSFHNDRLYTVLGGCIRFSDAKSVETMDRRFSRLYVPGNITMFKPVTDGIWLSFGGKTYFIHGLDPSDAFALIEKAPYGALGQAVAIPKELLVPGLQGFAGKTIAWMSSMGVCIGGDGGTMINLSARRYEIASGKRTAVSCLRTIKSGIGHFISVLRN